MSTDRFIAAMGCIDDDLISEAVTWMPDKKTPVRWVRWAAAAACFCLLAGLFVPGMLKGSVTGSPEGNLESNAVITDAKEEEHSYVSDFLFSLSLTAYAMENDDTISTVPMREGENIPVSFFEADNGLKGFIFSYEAEEPKDYLSFSIMTAGQQASVDEEIEAINGLELSTDNFYVFFIPPQDEPAPYSLPLTVEDEATNTIALLNVVIEQEEDGYIARIDSVTTYEKKMAP